MADVVVVVDEGHGNKSNLVDLGDGRALVIDSVSAIRGLPERRERLGPHHFIPSRAITTAFNRLSSASESGEEWHRWSTGHRNAGPPGSTGVDL